MTQETIINMAQRRKQIKVFDEPTTDNSKHANEFIQSLNIPPEAYDIQSHWNTILGGLIYVVIYETTSESKMSNAMDVDFGF